jgi:hypothetical protein
LLAHLRRWERKGFRKRPLSSGTEPLLSASPRRLGLPVRLPG